MLLSKNGILEFFFQLAALFSYISEELDKKTLPKKFKQFFSY